MTVKRQIDLNKNVYELVKSFPEMKDILYNLGFTDIKKPGMLETAGRFVTLPKGAKMKKIPLNEVVQILEAQGFEVIE